MSDTPKLIGVISQGAVLTGTLSSGSTLNATLSVPASSEARLIPATDHTLGGIIVGEDLQISPEGVLSIQKATEVEADNTHPITAAAVFTEVGNINALLATI